MPSRYRNPSIAHEAQLGRVVANLFRQQGWKVVEEPREKNVAPDFLVSGRRKKFVVELKRASEGRKDRVIPLLSWGRMEVDLLCTPSRIAIEWDGSQHLGDADAYRRDRRKDALLQENGYLILRFLAEDVGKHLDRVLDAILRALSHQDAMPLPRNNELTWRS